MQKNIYIFLASGNQKKAAVIILLLDKIDINSKAVTRDIEGLIKGSVHQEDIKIVNMFVSHIEASKYVKQV